MLLCWRVLCPSVVPFSPHWTGWHTVELHDASHFWHSPPNSASVATSHRTTSSMKESCHRQTGGESQCSRELATTPWYLQHTALCLPSRKPLWRELEPVDINSQWRESWNSSSVVNAHLVDDPTIWQPGFALPRQHWSLLNCFHIGQGHCSACKKKWKLIDSDQCSCDETQTMSHIVESCPLTRLRGGLSKLHSADDDVVAWLASYGS